MKRAAEAAKAKRLTEANRREMPLEDPPLLRADRGELGDRPLTLPAARPFQPFIRARHHRDIHAAGRPLSGDATGFRSFPVYVREPKIHIRAKGETERADRFDS